MDCYGRAMSLKDLTLVIPVFDRPDYLKRQVAYWSKHEVQIIIMDGSTTRASDLVLQEMTPRMRYFHSKMGFNQRLVEASKHVKTLYTVLLHDDEVYSVGGLSDCVRELETDSRIVGCQGRSMFFFYRDGQIFAHETYENASNLPNLYEDGLTRLRSSFISGDPSHSPYVLYAVFRSDIWKQLIVMSYGILYGSGYAYELAAQIAGNYLGPIKLIDSLVWFRSGENPAQTSISLNRKIAMGEWGTDRRFSSEKSLFITRVVELMTSVGRNSAEEIGIVVRETLQDFIEYSLHKPKRLKAKWHRILYFLNSLTPRIIKQILKKNMTPMLGKVLDYRGRSMSEALVSMENQGIKFDSSEMKELEQFLLDFHRKLEAN